MPSHGSNDDGDISRRPLLKGLGAAGLIGLAGCISEEGDAEADNAAEELIAEGFEEEGIEPPFETTVYANSDSPDRIAYGELIQNELNDTGFFDVSFSDMEWGAYLDFMNSVAEEEENALLCNGHSADWDPHVFMNNPYHSSAHSPSGINTNHFEDEEYDDLVDEGVEEPDQEARQDIYADAQERLVELSPVALIQFSEQITAWNNDEVSGFETHPMAGREFTAVYAPHEGAYTEVDNDDDELRVDLGSDVPDFDPISQEDTVSLMATTLVYESLIAVDFEGTPQPGLATDWEQEDDTTWRFYLREGVEFHNGDEFTAHDVQASYERYEDEVRESDVYDWYESSEIVGDHEIVIEHHRDYSGPFEATGAGDVPIVPEGVEDGNVDLTDGPVGTGPYQFVEHQEDDRFVIERYDDHWYSGDEYDNDVPETPPVETVVMEVIPEGSSRHQALEVGDIDLSQGLPAESVAEFEDDDDFDVDGALGLSNEYLTFPLWQEPFNNPKVRRGISGLIPRETIMDNVFHDVGELAYTPISPILEDFTGTDYQDELAEEHLEVQ